MNVDVRKVLTSYEILFASLLKLGILHPLMAE